MSTHEQAMEALERRSEDCSPSGWRAERWPASIRNYGSDRDIASLGADAWSYRESVSSSTEAEEDLGRSRRGARVSDHPIHLRLKDWPFLTTVTESRAEDGRAESSVRSSITGLVDSETVPPHLASAENDSHVVEYLHELEKAVNQKVGYKPGSALFLFSFFSWLSKWYPSSGPRPVRFGRVC